MNWKLEIGDNAGNQVAAPITVKEVVVSRDEHLLDGMRHGPQMGSVEMKLECEPDVLKQITDYYFPENWVHTSTSRGTLTVKPESNSSSFNVFNNTFLTMWQFYLNDEESFEVNATWKFCGKETILALPNELEPQPWVEGVWDETPEVPPIPPFWQTAPSFRNGAAKKEKSQLDWRRLGF